MGDKYANIAFTESVKSAQTEMGSRGLYARSEDVSDDNDRLGAGEVAFIAARDSFYLASISQTGWPYVQFRGGPIGFLRVIDEKTLGFLDFQGNRQYVTTGNVATNEKISLFLMDYPHRRRLKLFGKARILAPHADVVLTTRLAVAPYPGIVERVFVISLEAFDWNCPRHITPRYSEAELGDLLTRSHPHNAAETCQRK